MKTRLEKMLDAPASPGAGGIVRADDGTVRLLHPECCLPSWVVDRLRRDLARRIANDRPRLLIEPPPPKE